MSVPAFAHNNRSHHGHGSDRALGLEMLQDLKNIPKQRMRDLQCRRDNSNRDLCRIERVRKRTAQANLDRFNGRLPFVKRAIIADINERDHRRFNLHCGERRNPNRDLCRYERIVLNELNNVFLPEVNQAILNNRTHRDRINRDRIERERRERARRDRIERERRQRDRIERERRQRDRIERERRQRDRIERERSERQRRDRIERERRRGDRDRVKPGRGDRRPGKPNKPRKPRKPRRG